MKIQLPLALLLASGLQALAFGQQTEQLEQDQADTPTAQRREANFRGTNRPSTSPGQQEQLAAYLGTQLYLANQAEIELATLATQQAKHPEVKKFAETLAKEHRQVNQQLEQAMPGITKYASLQQEDSNRPGQSQQNREQTRDQDRRDQQLQGELRNSRDDASANNQQFLSGPMQDLAAICRRASETNLQMTTEMLREKQGAKFDMCFVSQQIGMHTWLVSELRAIRNVGPPEFTQIVDKAEQSTQQHLEHAKQLAQKLEGQLTSSNQSTARQSNPQGGQRNTQ